MVSFFLNYFTVQYLLFNEIEADKLSLEIHPLETMNIRFQPIRLLPESQRL